MIENSSPIMEMLIPLTHGLIFVLEFKEYTLELDVAFVRKALYAIGGCPIKL
jgi:hypothetical protein